MEMTEQNLAAPYFVKRPVAWRVKALYNDWQLFDDEEVANKHAIYCSPDAKVEALYIRDGSAIVAEWQPIETAPTGQNDFFLVCCDNPKDERGPFVVRGSFLADTRATGTPKHLSLSHLTHWMAIPAKPSIKWR